MPRRRTVRTALAAAVAAVLLFGAAAVAGRLGVPGLRIVFGPAGSANAPVGSNLFLGSPSTLEEARAQVSFEVRTPHHAGLGPAEVYVGRMPPGGRVSLVYPQRRGLPRSRFTRAGLLITEFEAHVDESYVKKGVVPNSQVDTTDVNDAQAVWFSGHPHEVYFIDRDGLPYAESLRMAGNTLVWSIGGVTIRLECQCSEAKALEIARSVY